MKNLTNEEINAIHDNFFHDEYEKTEIRMSQDSNGIIWICLSDVADVFDYTNLTNALKFIEEPRKHATKIKPPRGGRREAWWVTPTGLEDIFDRSTAMSGPKSEKFTEWAVQAVYRHTGSDQFDAEAYEKAYKYAEKSMSEMVQTALAQLPDSEFDQSTLDIDEKEMRQRVRTIKSRDVAHATELFWETARDLHSAVHRDLIEGFSEGLKDAFTLVEREINAAYDYSSRLKIENLEAIKDKKHAEEKLEKFETVYENAAKRAETAADNMAYVQKQHKRKVERLERQNKELKEKLERLGTAAKRVARFVFKNFDDAKFIDGIYEIFRESESMDEWNKLT